MEVISKVDDMKRRLYDYRTINRDIENSIERLERLEAKMYCVSATTMSDMPKSPSPSTDKFADLIDRKEKLEATVKNLMRKRDAEREAIERLSDALKNPDERAVINMRYLDCEEWDPIMEALYGEKDDFDDEYENYKQKLFRRHRAAISHLATLSQ